MNDQTYSCCVDSREYTFTPDEIRELNQQELAEYEAKTQMTPAEKRALRKWVASGHSVYEHPGSKYVCLAGVCPPPDFLSVYRMDREFKQALKGKTRKEKDAYLKEYFGYTEETEEEKERHRAQELTPDLARKYIHKLERECYYLWEFLYQTDLSRKAQDYVNAHEDSEIPFEW
ncbi:MAG: hypothetical protein LUJ25_01055 [Firmicutes bacterium]|nr:hypothetical protein [Bacillota bacterium]